MVANLIQHKGEFLNCGNNDLLALLQKRAKLLWPFCNRSNNGWNLRKAFDGIAKLLVQHPAVGNDNNRIKKGFAVFFQSYKLMRKPAYGITLAASGRMLDKVSLTNPINRSRSKEFSYHIKLMIAREYLFIFFLAGFLIFLFYDLCVVFKNIGKAVFLQSLFPEIISGDSLGIWRISSAVVIAFVERQKPWRFVFQMGTHPHFVVVNSKMHRTAPEMKQKLTGIPISLVLLNRIFHSLLGDFVFQLKSDYWQAVNKNRHIQGKLRIIHTVLQLACNAENVLFV